MIADLHHDERLKSATSEFILKHDKEIFNSDEWKRLMETNGKLAADTMLLKFNEIYSNPIVGNAIGLKAVLFDIIYRRYVFASISVVLLRSKANSYLHDAHHQNGPKCTVRIRFE
ncbi:hypothetical protein CEXT_658681 [Caerostris extrusa]|uniref:Uncharacterized protein n=1 Tax=Caerostris extrusa TaxID=172846 RepID=A0AAV4RGF1_CAEEX|nr:hypothetical protein CEXT_658681 [Caerostris extrusa]